MSIIKLAEESIGFVRRAGLRVLACGPGHARCLMPLAGNENHLGTMYAGAQFTLADITGGVLALASFDPARFYPILKQMNLEFLRPAQTDLLLEYTLPDEALAELGRQAEGGGGGKARFCLQGELVDGAGQVVARAQGEFQVRVR